MNWVWRGITFPWNCQMTMIYGLFFAPNFSWCNFRFNFCKNSEVAPVCCCCSHCMNSCKTAFSVFSCHFPTHTYSQIENQEAKNVMTSETSENFHRENPYHFLIRQFHLGIYFDFPFNIYLLLSAYFRHSYNIPSSSKMSIVTK